MDGLAAAAWRGRVFFIEPGERPDLFAAARGLDFATVRLDLADCRRSDDLFARMAAVFRFPEWFGDNWDALADCLADLSWWLARGYVLVIGKQWCLPGGRSGVVADAAGRAGRHRRQLARRRRAVLEFRHRPARGRCLIACCCDHPVAGDDRLRAIRRG
ncbi:barstar family protein [Pseudofulvimonas gallinarii]|uniref:barstar family protein n=1 Tax=Pseudofulvimonas gallinarii TaxID=634155 RepID=UPI0035E49AE7